MEKNKKFIFFLGLTFVIFLTLPFQALQARETCRCYTTGVFREDCNEACPRLCGELSRRSMENWNIELNLSPECQTIANQLQCRCYIWKATEPITTEEACTNICYALTVPNGELTGEFRDFTAPEPEEEAFPTYEIKPPIGEVTGPQLIGRIIKTVLALVGAFTLAMFIYGGFTWLTSGGSPDRIKKGRDIIVWATIGLAVIFASYTLVDFILKAFG